MRVDVLQARVARRPNSSSRTSSHRSRRVEVTPVSPPQLANPTAVGASPLRGSPRPADAGQPAASRRRRTASSAYTQYGPRQYATISRRRGSFAAIDGSRSGAETAPGKVRPGTRPPDARRAARRARREPRLQLRCRPARPRRARPGTPPPARRPGHMPSRHVAHRSPQLAQPARSRAGRRRDGPRRERARPAFASSRR